MSKIFLLVSLSLTIAYIISMCACNAKADTPHNFHLVEYNKSDYGGVMHDESRQVTCWFYSDNSISCIPDWQLKKPEERK